MSAEQASSFLWTEVASIEKRSSAPGFVHAFAIDTPQIGERSPGAGLEINGWAIGSGQPLAGVQAVSGDCAEGVQPLAVRRPDVTADYRDIPHAANSGFSIWAPLPETEGSWSLTLQAVLADGSTSSLAELRGNVVREYRRAGKGARLVNAPDFAIIGTQRGGTTSLHAYLNEHPLIATPPTKELHFITDRYQRGRDWYLGQFPSEVNIGMLTGEATPYALFHPLAPQRMRAVAPGIKLIVLLRNPVDRAYSHYLLERSRGDETLPFAEALDVEPRRLAGEEERILADEAYVSEPHKHASYLARGHYKRQLEGWLALFPREQFVILRSEDLYASPDETLRRVTSFLGLPPLTGGVFVAHNRTTGPPLDPGLGESLTRHFAPSNSRLARLLGWDPRWESAHELT